MSTRAERGRRRVTVVIRKAHVNGVTLVYREEGDPSAPPLLLVHGRTADHNDWNGITQHFARRHHVIVPDLRGHGGSDHPGTYALPDMAADLVALLDHVGAARATVIGHSLGGVVSCLLASGSPGRVDRLVLEDVPTLPLRDRDPIVEDGSTGFDWRMMHETERQFLDPDPRWRQALTAITAPTLVLSGGAASPFHADETAALIPGAKLVTIEAGHLIHVGARAGFLRAVDSFLAG